MATIELVKMKAKAVGTVVGDTVNAAGDVNSNCIVHVDPDNKGEDGRYTDPIVTEDVAKKLELAGYAERVGKAVLKAGMLISGVDADQSAGRVAAVADIDHKAPGAGPSGLDTSHSVNFADGDKVRGGAPGRQDATDASDDADAAPAPAAKPRGKAAGTD